jgi:hypothetical protein
MDEVELLECKETEDGGAILHFQLTPLATKVFIEKGIISTLMECIDDEARSLHERKDEDGTK